MSMEPRAAARHVPARRGWRVPETRDMAFAVAVITEITIAMGLIQTTSDAGRTKVIEGFCIVLSIWLHVLPEMD